MRLCFYRFPAYSGFGLEFSLYTQYRLDISFITHISIKNVISSCSCNISFFLIYKCRLYSYEQMLLNFFLKCVVPYENEPLGKNECFISGEKVPAESKLATVSTIYGMIMHCRNPKASAVQKLYTTLCIRYHADNKVCTCTSCIS